MSTTTTSAGKKEARHETQPPKFGQTPTATDGVANEKAVEFISLTQAVEKSGHNSVSYGLMTYNSSNNRNLSQSNELSQSVRTSPRLMKKNVNATSALGRLLNANKDGATDLTSDDRRSVETSNTSNNNSMETNNKGCSS